MADINAVAKQFTDFYFTTFDTNRGGLQSLYVRPQAGCESLSSRSDRAPFLFTSAMSPC